MAFIGITGQLLYGIGLFISDYLSLQGLSERMAFLKLLVLGTESTIGAQICGKILIRGIHF